MWPSQQPVKTPREVCPRSYLETYYPTYPRWPVFEVKMILPCPVRRSTLAQFDDMRVVVSGPVQVVQVDAESSPASR